MPRILFICGFLLGGQLLSPLLSQDVGVDPEKGPPIIDRAQSLLSELEAKAFGLQQSSFDFDERDMRHFAHEFAEVFFSQNLSGPRTRSQLVETTEEIIIELESFDEDYSPENFDEMLDLLDEALLAKLQKMADSKEFKESQNSQRWAAVVVVFLPEALSLGVFLTKVVVIDGGRVLFYKGRQFFKGRAFKRARKAGQGAKARKCAQQLVVINQKLKGAAGNPGEDGQQRASKKLRRILVYPMLLGVPLGAGSWFFYYEDRHLYDAQEDLIDDEWRKFFRDN